MVPDPTNTTIETLLQHAGWLDELARRLVSDRNEADEIVQDTWIAALTHPPRHATHLRGWLARIARNLAVQRGRSERARKLREQTTAREEASTADNEALDRARTLRRLVDAVLTLDEPYRSTLVLHYFEHMPIADVAERQAVPESTVRTRLWRAIGILREKFRHEDGGTWSLAFMAFVPKSKAVATAASTSTAAWSSSTAIGGIAMATAWKVGVSIAAVIILGWALWPTHDDSIVRGPDVVRGPDKTSNSLSPDGKERAGRVALEATKPVEPIDASAAPSTPDADRASLDVHVKWGDDGSPAAGVSVSLLQFGSPDLERERRAGRTDDHGVAHFESMYPGFVSIQLDRCEGGQVDLLAGQHAKIEFTIPDGTDVDAHVVDDRGESVPRARIWISTGSTSDGMEIGKADLSGHVHLRDVRVGCAIAALCDGHGPSTQARIDANPTKTAVAIELELTMPLGRVRGVVLDSAGAPIAGADVELTSRNDAFTQRPSNETGYFPPVHVQSDAAGAFETSDLRNEDVWVAVRAAGFVAWKGTLHRGLEERLLEIRMSTQAVVHGFVRDDAGAPILRAHVCAEEWPMIRTSTRADGSYRLESLPAGRIRLRADVWNGGSSLETFELKAGDEVAWDVTLRSTPSVTGRVVNEAGRPLVNWRVDAIGPKFGYGSTKVRNTLTDVEGRFEIPSWPDDAYAIEVREPDRSSSDPAASRSGIKAGARDLVLVVRGEDMGTARIVGRILAPDGTGMSATELYLHVPRSSTSFPSRTDHEGRFEIKGLRTGSYWIEITPDHAPPKELRDLEISAGDQVLDLGDIHIDGSGVVHVHVRLPPGVDRSEEPPWIMLGPADWSWVRQFRLRSGAGIMDGTMDGVPAGEYVIAMKDYSLHAKVARVMVKIDHTTEVQIDSEPGTERSVKLSWSVDGPQPKVTYLRAFDGSNTEIYYSTVPAGMTSVGVWNLGVGTYRVEATSDVGIRAEADLKVDDLGKSKDVLLLELK